MGEPAESSLGSYVAKNENALGYRIAYRYACFMVSRPYINLGAILVLVTIGGVLGFVPPIAQPLPDFKDPVKGFNPRGTTISSRSNPLRRLSDVSGIVSVPPDGTIHQPRQRRSLSVNICQTSMRYYIDGMTIVYEGKLQGSNLYTLANMKSICKLHKKIVHSNHLYINATVRRFINGSNVPCPSYGLPNIIAAHYSRKSCEHITQGDLDQLSKELVYCAKFYRSGALLECINKGNCVNIPSNCSNASFRDHIYQIFHYLTDSDFSTNPTILKFTLITEPLIVPFSSSTVNGLYKSVYETSLKDLNSASDGNVKVAAFDFYDLRFTLFNSLLLKEATFIGIALVLVLIFIWIFSGSFFIALMTYVCVIFAFILAYFVYGIIFRLSFFPFLNVTTLIFLVGIGADDAFVYVGIWNEAKRLLPYCSGENYTVYLNHWTTYALRHAVVAMFVTSFTTAAAFYASVTSKIIAVKCFGVFAGTSILTNYFLMVTLFPVVVIIHEKYLVNCMNRCCPKVCPPRNDAGQQAQTFTMSPTGERELKDYGDAQVPQTGQPADVETKREGVFHRILAIIDRVTTAIFDHYLPILIIKLRYLWVLVFLGIGIGGLVVVLYKPKLNLPVSSDFQMFSSSSSLEQFLLTYKTKFPFGRSSSGWFMESNFVFGIKAVDNRNPFNPGDKGSTELKSSFSITEVKEQIWLNQFCGQLQNASFSRSRYISFCDNLQRMWLRFGSSCGSVGSLNKPCCALTVPAKPAVYDYCIKSFAKNVSVVNTGVKFDQSGNIRAVTFEVMLKYQYSNNYDYNKGLFDSIEEWVKPRMKAAPGGFKDGFWTTELKFFDLQTALAIGTQQSLAIAVAIAFLVVLITTWNPLLSFYAILSIICVIAVTVGTLVLAGWRLNILESIVFSVAAGLSIDFTLHFGVAYQASPEKGDRIKRVRYSLRHIGAAVTMGAITTFIAGLAMSPASILAYIQMSQFLMLVMTVSWCYATFFFLSLCAVIGPAGNFCQLSLATVRPGSNKTVTVNEEPMDDVIVNKKDLDDQSRSTVA